VKERLAKRDGGRNRKTLQVGGAVRLRSEDKPAKRPRTPREHKI
jgi:hypothetical protein